VYRPAKLRVPSSVRDIRTLRFPPTSRRYSSYPLSLLFPSFVIPFTRLAPPELDVYSVLTRYKDSRERERKKKKEIRACGLLMAGIWQRRKRSFLPETAHRTALEEWRTRVPISCRCSFGRSIKSRVPRTAASFDRAIKKRGTEEEEEGGLLI